MHRKKLLAWLAIVVACLACGWLGFWLGFSEMFFQHVEGQYASDVAELITERHWVRCLEDDPSKAIANMKAYLKIKREGLMVMTPRSVSLMDRVQVVADPHVMWVIMQQRDNITARLGEYAAFVSDESRPAACGGASSGGAG